MKWGLFKVNKEMIVSKNTYSNSKYIQKTLGKVKFASRPLTTWNYRKGKSKCKKYNINEILA